MSESLVLPYALGLLLRDGKVLLIKRSHTGFGDGMYALPGGKVDNNESPAQAVVRELAEELGIQIFPHDVSFGTTLYFQGATRLCVAFVFNIATWQGEPFNKEPEKHDHCQWFPLSALPGTLLPRHVKMVHNATTGVWYADEGFGEL